MQSIPLSVIVNPLLSTFNASLLPPLGGSHGSDSKACRVAYKGWLAWEYCGSPPHFPHTHPPSSWRPSRCSCPFGRPPPPPWPCRRRAGAPGMPPLAKNRPAPCFLLFSSLFSDKTGATSDAPARTRYAQKERGITYRGGRGGLHTPTIGLPSSQSMHVSWYQIFLSWEFHCRVWLLITNIVIPWELRPTYQKIEHFDFMASITNPDCLPKRTSTSVSIKWKILILWRRL